MESENRTNAEKPWLFQKGQSGNPGGRPKNTLKSYLQRKFNDMTDGEKELWLQDNKISGVDQWKMAEGNPRQDTDMTSGDKPIQVIIPVQIAEAFNIDATHTPYEETGRGDTE